MRTPRSIRTAVLLACAGLSACSLPPQRADFSSPDPQERTLAVARAAREDDRQSIPYLIQTLESPDPAQRMLAIGSLERLTGQTLGYEYWATDPVRRASIDRWQAWWREAQNAPGPGPGSSRTAQGAPTTASP